MPKLPYPLAKGLHLEALHRIHFYDAWRTQQVLGAPEPTYSPPGRGRLPHGRQRRGSESTRKRVTALAIVQRPQENGEDCSAMPPQGVDAQKDSFPSHSSELPIKRRPGSKAGAGRGQSKRLRESADQTFQPPLRSIPEHGQQPVTLEDLADPADQLQESPQQEEAQKHPQAMTEIDPDNDQKNVERGSTAATDLQ